MIFAIDDAGFRKRRRHFLSGSGGGKRFLEVTLQRKRNGNGSAYEKNESGSNFGKTWVEAKTEAGQKFHIVIISS